MLKMATAKPFYKLLSTIIDENSQYYEVGINYPALLTKLSHDSDEVANNLREVFTNLVYDSQQILHMLKMIIHWQFVESGKKEKKISLSIMNFPVTDMADLKAHMVDNFISVQAVVIKVQQVRLMSTSMEFSCF